MKKESDIIQINQMNLQKIDKLKDVKNKLIEYLMN